MRHHVAAILILSVMGSGMAVAQGTQPASEIDLKLFEKTEIDRSRGCSMALWQANRDPEADRFAFIFLEPFRGEAHQPDPARIKIGNTVIPLQRVSSGGPSEGYGVQAFQLYKMPDEQGYVVLDLKLEPEVGETVEISSGKLMVTMLGKIAFRASVKGGVGCVGAPLPGPAGTQAARPAVNGGLTAGTLSNAPPSLPGPGLQASSIPSGDPAGRELSAPAPFRNEAEMIFERYAVRAQQVPARFLARINQRFGCTIQNQRGAIVGFQMSEESAIWQVPCDQYGQRTTSVFALVAISAPESQFEILETPAPRGRPRKLDPGVLMSAQWDMRSRTVTSLYPLGERGDCGVFERFGITPEGRFVLIEMREKTRCDGQVTRPEQWPSVIGRR